MKGIREGSAGTRSVLLLLVALAAAAALVIALQATALAGGGVTGRFNRAGNVLIADQFNNRVIEVDRTGAIVWTFGSGSATAGPDAVVAPNDAERLPNGLTLIAGTGAPAGTPGYPPEGAVDNRVILVTKAGRIVWQYGQAGVTGSGWNMLNTPVQATYLPNGNVLVTDQGNQRVIEVSRVKRRIVWSYGMTGVAGSGPRQLSSPNSAELIRGGHVLIADEGNNRVIEVDRRGNIVWQYGSPDDTATLNAPAFASRLPNGHTLISDSLNNRIVEVDMAKNVVWTYYTNLQPGSVTDPVPTRAVRLRNGNTLIANQFDHQVVEVDPSMSVVWTYGQIGVAGMGPGQLNAPYDAKVIGDFTGLTRPPMGRARRGMH